MKKNFAIVLMFLYLIPAIGVSLSAHYCGGELTSVSHQFSKKEKCSCSPGKMKKGCCEDKQQTFKMDNIQQKVELLSQKFSTPVFESTLPSFFQTPIVFPKKDTTAYVLFPPPNVFSQPLYLLNNVFRI